VTAFIILPAVQVNMPGAGQSADPCPGGTAYYGTGHRAAAGHTTANGTDTGTDRAAGQRPLTASGTTGCQAQAQDSENREHKGFLLDYINTHNLSSLFLLLTLTFQPVSV